MKKWFLFACLAGLFSLLACHQPSQSSEASAEDSIQASTTKGDAPQSLYQCPMKCEKEKTYTEASKCPVCGMALAPVGS